MTCFSTYDYSNAYKQWYHPMTSTFVTSFDFLTGSSHFTTQCRCLTQVWMGAQFILKHNYFAASVCLILADTAVLSNTHRITRSSPKLCLFCSIDSFWCCFSGCPFSTVVPLSSWSSWELIPSCISRISYRKKEKMLLIMLLPVLDSPIMLSYTKMMEIWVSSLDSLFFTSYNWNIYCILL